MSSRRAVQGFGCMGWSAFYGSASTNVEQAVAVFTRAVDQGVTLFNTATFYGPLHAEGYGANLKLLKPCLEAVDRSKVQVMCKVGMDTRAPVDAPGTQFQLRVDDDFLRWDVDLTLELLGVDCLDVVVLCRCPKAGDRPIEAVMESLQTIVDEGKAKHIGLSEANSATLRRASTVAPVFALEQEWSLQSRDAEADLVPTCRALGTTFVAYSPLGRGFLTGTLRSREAPQFGDHDLRLVSPRFEADALARNLKAVDALEAMAADKQCTVGQLSLAFLHAQGPDVIPIPGTTSLAHLEENLAARDIVLTPMDLARLDQICPPTGEHVMGDRYGEHAMAACYPALPDE